MLDKLQSIFDRDPFIISDTHFFHDKVYSVFEPSRKIFADSREDFDEKLFSILNNASPLLHLGDVAINSKNQKKFYERVNYVGEKLNSIEKILLVGNHDSGAEFLYKKTGWDVVDCGINLDSKEIYYNTPAFIVKTIGNEKILFSHEPAFLADQIKYDEGLEKFKTKTQELLGEIYIQLGITKNVHGHVHSHSLSSDKHVNVSIENLDFYPKRLSKIVQDMDISRKSIYKYIDF